MHITSYNKSGQSSNTIKKRDSSFELLRIIAMFSITICHLATHGNFYFDSQTLSIPKFWWYFIELGGNFGVNIFVLISGYFLILDNCEVINVKKILKIWGQIFFYSVLICVVFGSLGVTEFSFNVIAKSMFPITFENWWFASTYFVLYLLHPFLNMLLRRIDKKTFQNLLILLISIWCIIPSVTFSEYQSNKLLWFITLYSIAAYIRLFDFNPFFRLKHYICFCFIFSIIRYFSSIILIIIGTKISYVSTHTLAFYGRQSVFTLLSSLSMFMVFKNLNINYSKWINGIASATFGVYLIHDHSIIRKFLWIKVFKVASYQDSLLLIPYSIGVVLLIFIICTFLDLLRQAVIEKTFLNVIEKETANLIKSIKAVLTICRRITFGNQT